MSVTPATLVRRSHLGAAGLGLLLCAATLLPGAAFAQNDLEALLACRDVRDDDARLACYDRALGVEASAKEPRPPADRADAAPAAAAAGTAARRADTPPPAAEAPPPRPAAATPPPRPAAETPPPRPARAEDDGGRDEDAEEGREVVVVDVLGTQRPNVTFVLDDGEVWRQTDGRRTRFDDPPFEAEIRAGALGSFFLVPKDGARAIRVRRVDEG
ncbi:MAG TPA: hypothetical protein VF322_12980 [Gammaproteobacteria bacterium]